MLLKLVFFFGFILYNLCRMAHTCIFIGTTIKIITRRSLIGRYHPLALSFAVLVIMLDRSPTSLPTVV